MADGDMTDCDRDDESRGDLGHLNQSETRFDCLCSAATCCGWYVGCGICEAGTSDWREVLGLPVTLVIDGETGICTVARCGFVDCAGTVAEAVPERGR